jgi:uncharacterized UPF0160 family protein
MRDERLSAETDI